MVINAADLQKSRKAESGCTDLFETIRTSDEKKKTINAKKAYKADFLQGKTKEQQPVYQKPQQEKTDTPIQNAIEQSFSNMDATQRKNQMVVLSNTMTPQDYEKAREDGFPPEETTGTTMVTEMDKIKMTLAEAGVDISCFGDTPDMETIQKYIGNKGVAIQVAQSLQKADLPITQDNVAELAQTMQQAEKLQPLDSEAVKYLLDTQKEPTVENLYTAEHCSSIQIIGEETVINDVSVQVQSYMDEGLTQQMHQVIEQAGFSTTNQNVVDTAKWMVQEQIPLTEKNLQYAMDLQALKLPLKQEEMVEAAVDAMKEGKRSSDAILIPKYRLEVKAKQAENTIRAAKVEDMVCLLQNEQPITLQTLYQMQEKRKNGEENHTFQSDMQLSEIPEFTVIKAQRVLAEAQLTLTASSAYQLLKQGIELEMKPLGELVDQLKESENKYYRQLLAQNNVEASEENVALFRETTEGVEAIKEIPAYTLGRVRLLEKQPQENTLRKLLQVGKELQTEMEKANQRYETMQTQVRPDLGDSIKKAFGNVEEMLKDCGMKVTEDNKRAVRILGYNQMEVTPDTVVEIRAADQQVQQTFEHLKPAVVLSMIKKGIRPLDMNIAKLNQTAEQILQEQGDGEIDSFSKFLYRVEQKQEISKEERDAYIGMYRLIHQVEKTDHAVIGAVVHQGREMTMRNLITAVRSMKKTGRTYTVEDESEWKSGTIENSITEQMERVYQQECLHHVKKVLTPQKAQKLQEQEWMSMTPEEIKEFINQMPVQQQEKTSEEAYVKEQLEQYREAAEAPRQIYELLEQFELPNTVGNILAMRQMVSGKRNIFSQIFDSLPDTEEMDKDWLKEQTLKQFGEAVKTPEDLAEAEKTLADTAENVMKTMLASDAKVSHLDLQQLRMAANQMEIVTHMVKDEQYAIPVMVGNELTDVSLKIVRGKKEKGKVELYFDSPTLGKIAMQIKVSSEKLDGIISAEKEETLQLFIKKQERLQEQLKTGRESEWHYICAKPNTLFGRTKIQAVESDNTDKQRQVQTKELYGLASRLLKGIGEIRYTED